MSDEKAARLAAIRAANAAGQDAAPVDSDEKAARLAAIRAAKAATAPVRTAAPTDNDIDSLPAMPLHTLLLTLIAVCVGVFAAVVALPTWLPGLSASLLGTEPKAYWYLSRSSALVAYGLLWLSMVFGLLMTNRMARAWPGGPVAFDLHQHASLLGLAFALFHALILMGDRYIKADLRQVLVPFSYAGYNPLWVGLGQVGIYLMALIGLSFYMKGLIGRAAWRAIHFISFVLFALVLIHGIWSGSDTALSWIQGFYWFTGGSVLFLTAYRIVVSGRKRPAATSIGDTTPLQRAAK
jgi:predicted ferric reductase